MDLSHLDTMSVKQLRELLNEVDNAIRAQIAKMRIQTEAKSMPPPNVPVIDLEHERDLWKSRR